MLDPPSPPAASPADTRAARPPKRRPRRLRAGPRPPLTVEQILAWADDHDARNGRWPTGNDRAVLADRNEKWCNVNAALQRGHRGLPGGSSLAQLLVEHRGVRNKAHLPELSEDQILAWADAAHARTGRWPGAADREAMPEAPGEKWNCIDQVLRSGGRGLPGGDTLARLLARRRGVRNLQDLPPLTEDQVLAWSEAHHRRTGAWPTYYLGAVADAPGESWKAINSALRDGGRALPGGSSLAQLLASRLGVRNKTAVPALKVGWILARADAHRRRTGDWPRVQSGPVEDAPGETWLAIDSALREGLRGLPGGDSLARLLARRRGARNKAQAPPLRAAEILRWADEHHRRTGGWPKPTSGPVRAAPGETWGAVQQALFAGQRGLPGGDSLAQLLARRRGVPNPAARPPLTEGLILRWADAHHRRTGQWPGQLSGPVAGAPGESWGAIQRALQAGCRGLPGGDSIRQLLVRTGRRT